MKANYSGSLSALAIAVAAAYLSTHSYAQGSVALEEVVVTAKKREQSYLDVPVSVNTFTGEVLDMAKVTEFQDLVQVSPSVPFSQTGDQRGVGVLIRGIGTTAFQTAVEPTVATVIDGITMGRTAQSVTDFDGNPRTQREADGILDFIAGVEASDGTWQAELFVKNALDEFYVDRPAFSATFQADQGFLTHDAWRYMVLEVNYRF